MTQTVGWCEAFTIHNLAHLVSFFSGLNELFTFSPHEIRSGRGWTELGHFTLGLAFGHWRGFCDTFRGFRWPIACRNREFTVRVLILITFEL